MSQSEQSEQKEGEVVTEEQTPEAPPSTTNGQAAAAPAPAPAEPSGGQAPEAAPGTADLQAEIARLKEEKRELNDRMLRVAADFDNYRKRIRREMEEAGLRGMEALLKELLPVLDNLDRAVDAAGASEQAGAMASALLDGVKLVQRQFLSALEKFQVRTFEALGKPFDPAVHEAVQQVESDTLPPGSVAAVFQRGYTAGNRLLRPALVAVTRARPQPAPESETSGDGAAAANDLIIDDEPERS
jgi:molecular chaperone GrpE